LAKKGNQATGLSKSNSDFFIATTTTQQAPSAIIVDLVATVAKWYEVTWGACGSRCF
jgi:hypothetical protein